MLKIARVSLFLQTVFLLCLLALPIITVIGWYFAPEPFSLFAGSVKWRVIPLAYNDAILHVVSLPEKLLGFCVSFVSLAFESYILISLLQLFQHYRQGEIFSVKNVRIIRNIGYALLAGQLYNPIQEFLLGIILTLHNPHGHRFATISLDQTDLGILLTAVMVIFISWIMAEAYQLREEQQLTI